MPRDGDSSREHFWQQQQQSGGQPIKGAFSWQQSAKALAANTYAELKDTLALLLKQTVVHRLDPQIAVSGVVLRPTFQVSAVVHAMAAPTVVRQTITCRQTLLPAVHPLPLGIQACVQHPEQGLLSQNVLQKVPHSVSIGFKLAVQQTSLQDFKRSTCHQIPLQTLGSYQARLGKRVSIEQPKAILQGFKAVQLGLAQPKAQRIRVQPPGVNRKSSGRFVNLPIDYKALPIYRFSAEKRDWFKQQLAQKAQCSPQLIQLRAVFYPLSPRHYLQVNELSSSSGGGLRQLRCIPKPPDINPSQNAFQNNNDRFYLLIADRLDTQARVKAFVLLQ